MCCILNPKTGRPVTGISVRRITTDVSWVQQSSGRSIQTWMLAIEVKLTEISRLLSSVRCITKELRSERLNDTQYLLGLARHKTFMTKRRRSIHVSDDDWVGDASISDISTGFESDDHDASFTLKRRSGKSVTKRSKLARDTDNSSVNDGFSPSMGSESPAHPASLHSIREPAAIRDELLKWYKTVQNNRGMPWRKSYDPNLAADGRAQRAYEVCSPPPSHTGVTLFRYGSPK